MQSLLPSLRLCYTFVTKGLKHGVLEGTYLFDNEKGRLVEQQSTVTMTIAINDATELKTVQTLKLGVRE